MGEFSEAQIARAKYTLPPPVLGGFTKFFGDCDISLPQDPTKAIRNSYLRAVRLWQRLKVPCRLEG